MSFPVDVAVSAFEPLVLPSGLVLISEPDGCDESVLALEFATLLEPVGRSVLIVRSPELFGGAWSREDLGSLVADTSSVCRGGAPRSADGSGAESLPASVAVLLSTNAAKLSLDCDGSGRAGFCGAV